MKRLFGHLFSHSTFDVERSMFDVHFLNVLLDPFKTAAMNRAATKFSNGFLVGPGRIAFMFGEIELGIIMMVFLHQAIPRDFGDYRCRGYGDT
jgi:hypothetical protein